MRRIRQIIWIVVTGLVTQAAVAGDPLEISVSPLGELQAQLDALELRTQALEDSAPTSDVEGRTYCFVLELSVMRGRSFDATEELQTSIIRRTATFAGGSFTGAYLSNVFNNQTDDGVVEHSAGPVIDPLTATYVQSGTKLDVTFPSGRTTTWYVSQDGSLIHGTKIEHSIFAGGAFTVGFLRNWTLVETNPLDTCDADGQ